MEHKFIKNRDIVMFSFQPWDTEIGSNFKDIAKELAKANRVLYVNRALDRITLIKNRNNPQVKSRLASIRNGTNELVEVQPRLWVQNPRTIVESINWIPFPGIHDRLNKINNQRLARQINHAIHELGFSAVILINDNDFIRGRYLKHMVKCADYIFYKRDYMLGVSYFQRHGPRLEAVVLREANLVATNSAYLQKLAKQFNPNSVDIGQGCDAQAYFAITADNIPEDIRPLRKPVIGYTGYISAWRIDTDILLHIAAKFPACSIVLIGPIDELFQTQDLSHRKNVHFLGYKPPELLPAYTQHFDICINPQVVNEITRGNYPRKIDEYLAMGKPVVATATDAMDLFEPYIWLCKTKTDFSEKIAKILGDPGKYMSEQEKARRISFALTHTWTNSVGRLGDAYYNTQNNLIENTVEKPTESKTSWLHKTTIYLLVAFLVFIYFKFLFY